MERKKKPNGILISGLISALASLAIVAVAPSFAGKPDKTGKPEQSSTDTKGNDRKGGYEDNSKTPQETNQGKGSDRDGDADSDPSTSYTEDNDTNDGGTKNNVSDDGDNRHPSGKDRSVEKGKSGNQGKAESNPDDSKGPMRYEGAQGDDKPNGPGGTDLADQDGNNGCGNDDDFDDDNNGWCGRNPKRKDSKPPVKKDSKPPVKKDSKPPVKKDSKPPVNDEVKGVIVTKTCPNGAVMPVNENCSIHAPEVAPEVATNPAQPDEDVLGARIDQDQASGKPEQGGPSVLGIRLSPALNEPVKVAGAVLPFTGGDVLLFLVLALALFGSGVLIMRSTKAKAHTS